MKIKEAIQTESCLVFLFGVQLAKDGRDLNIHKRKERSYSFCFLGFSMLFLLNKGEMEFVKRSRLWNRRGRLWGRAMSLAGRGRSLGSGLGASIRARVSKGKIVGTIC